MPVLGHAFAGLAIGIATEDSQSKPEAASPWWIPTAVVLSYIPDLSTQLLHTSAGWNWARVLSHSLVFAVATSVLAVPWLKRMSAVSTSRAFLIAFLCIGGHDLLDLAQATDRAPWWPLSSRVTAFALLPAGAAAEILIFGLAFVVVVLVRCRRKTSRDVARVPRNPWPARITVVVLMLAAASTQYLQSVRERHFENAHALLEAGQYSAALQAIAEADKWPSVAKPGRTDYIRGAAHAGMGNRSQAEFYYLRSYAADPGYFWLVVDLADFYSNSGRPLPERQRSTEPFLRQLQTEFRHESQQANVIDRIERHITADRDHPLSPSDNSAQTKRN